MTTIAACLRKELEDRFSPFSTVQNACRPACERRSVPWVLLIVGLGLLLRLLHYVRDPAVWHDEAAMILNVLAKDFGALLGPLLHYEAAPPLFLWLEKACVLLLGDSTYALRLPSLLASCGSLVVLAWLARRALRPAAVPWAVLLAACSDRLLWHTCETKSYALDVLAAAGLPALFLATRGWALPRRLLLFAAIAPVVIFLLYPGCFLLGGVLLAFLLDMPYAKNPGTRDNSAPADKAALIRPWLCYGFLAGAVGVSFLLLVLGPARAQRCAEMESCWLHAFPRWDRPWLLPWWALKATVEVVDYCFRPLGGCLAPLAALGGYLFWRRGRYSLLLVLAAPLALGCAAGSVHSYPYTGARVMVYALPCLALLIGEAAAFAFAWLRSLSAGLMPRALVAALVGLLLAPLVLSLGCAVQPWSRTDWHSAYNYARQHFQPGDFLLSNTPEMGYHGRNWPGPSFRPMNGPLPDQGGRAWVLVMGDTEAKRLTAVERVFQAEQKILQQATFQGVTVYCVGRSDSGYASE